MVLVGFTKRWLSQRVIFVVRSTIQNRMITTAHTNVLSSFLADWSMKIRFLPKVKVTSAPVKSYAGVFRAISTGERDINTLLRLIDERLRILERRPLPSFENIKDFDFIADVETIVLLKALYVHVRIYLDAISGVIRYFHRQMNLPKSFNDLLKKLQKRAIPDDLFQVLSLAPNWFKKFKDTRDDLVHHYEDFLLLFNANVIHHASLSKIKGNRAFDYGSIRSCVGEFLKNIQIMIDRLLDHFDKKFFDWYGFVQSSASRSRTIIEGGYMLYWAHKYGGYSHPELQISENQVSNIY
jgi:hypothetical protein